MTNKFNLDKYNLYLNHHARVLLFEYQIAFKNKLWATSLVLSLTIIDNILSDEANLDFMDGPNLNRLKNLKELHWLRMRRNKVLHYEGYVEGFGGNKEGENILKTDAIKADDLIKYFLKDFFSQKSL